MTEGEKQKQQLDREIKDMISALTHRLADLQRGGGSSHEDDHNDQAAAAAAAADDGVRIITLAGSNVGATMRSELDAEFWKPSADGHLQGDVSPGLQEHEPLTALVNSNFQAINNSLMLGGSYSTNDPGVNMDVSDGYNNNNNNNTNNNNSMEHHQTAHQKRGKEGKKKAKEATSKSDHHSQVSDA